MYEVAFADLSELESGIVTRGSALLWQHRCIAHTPGLNANACLECAGMNEGLGAQRSGASCLCSGTMESIDDMNEAAVVDVSAVYCVMLERELAFQVRNAS